MMILTLGTASLIAVHASIPPRLGIRTSMRTMSGVVSTTFCTASAPSSASPTTSMSGSCSSTISRPRRNKAWSSTTRTRIGSPLTGAGGGAASGISVTSSPSVAGLLPLGYPGLFAHDVTLDAFGPVKDDNPSGRAVPRMDQSDDPVVIAPAPVDDARRPAFGIDEQVEVVPDQFHLEQRLVERHRRGDVVLLTH